MPAAFAAVQPLSPKFAHIEVWGKMVYQILGKLSDFQF